METPAVNHDTFRLIDFDEAGPQESDEGRHRLVCKIEGGGKLAIWGSRENTVNIDAVVEAGVPCIVRCEWQAPRDWAVAKYEHTHWVPEDASLGIFRSRR